MNTNIESDTDARIVENFSNRKEDIQLGSKASGLQVTHRNGKTFVN